MPRKLLGEIVTLIDASESAGFPINNSKEVYIEWPDLMDVVLKRDDKALNVALNNFDKDKKIDKIKECKNALDEAISYANKKGFNYTYGFKEKEFDLVNKFLSDFQSGLEAKEDLKTQSPALSRKPR